MQVKKKLILSLLSAVMLSLGWPERGLTPLIFYCMGAIAAFGRVQSSEKRTEKIRVVWLDVFNHARMECFNNMVGLQCQFWWRPVCYFLQFIIYDMCVLCFSYC